MESLLFKLNSFRSKQPWNLTLGCITWVNFGSEVKTGPWTGPWVYPLTVEACGRLPARFAFHLRVELINGNADEAGEKKNSFKSWYLKILSAPHVTDLIGQTAMTRIFWVQFGWKHNWFILSPSSSWIIRSNTFISFDKMLDTVNILRCHSNLLLSAYQWYQ